MKKGILTSLICFTSLLFSSCGSKTVKVKFTNDEFVSWGKSEDIANVGKNYEVTAIPKRGYWLYEENLSIVINGLPRFKDVHYTFDENTQKVTIIKSSISGTIEIDGKAEGAYKICTLTIKVPTGFYEGIENYYNECNISSPNFERPNVSSKNGKQLKPISVSPEGVKYTYDITDGTKASFKINSSEFYRDITVTFPSLD